MNIRFRATLICFVVALGGCTPSTNAVIESVRTAVGNRPDPTTIRLNPAFRYLRVTVRGSTAIMALGYIENHPSGPIEIWYSAQKEVLRLQNGRVVGAVGLTTEWRNVQLAGLQPWSEYVLLGHAAHLVRHRDVMPGYRFGIKDELTLQAIDPPSKHALSGIDARSLTWFEERIDRAAYDDKLGPDQSLPPAKYAVDLQGGKETVVYGEQCLTEMLCFTWQRWPVHTQNLSTQR